MINIGSAVTFSGASWRLAYEEVPAVDSDLGATDQEGYVFGILKDGVAVYQTRFVKSSIENYGKTPADLAALFLKGVNAWLVKNGTAVTTATAATTDWKAVCMAIFAKMFLQVTDGVLTVGQGA